MVARIFLVLGASDNGCISFCPHGAGGSLSRTVKLTPNRGVEVDLNPAHI